MQGPGKAAWTISLLLHGGLVGLMLFGPSLRPTQRPQPPAGVIEGVVLDAKDIQRLANLELPEPDPKVQAERKRAVEERKRIREQRQKEREQRLELERKQQAEREKKRPT